MLCAGLVVSLVGGHGLAGASYAASSNTVHDVAGIALPDTTATDPPPRTVDHDGVLRINDPLHRFLERQQTLGRLPRAVLTHQPLSVGEAHRHLDSLQVRRSQLSASEQAMLDRYQRRTDRPGAAWGQRSGGFANGHDLLSASGAGYAVQANPVLYGTAGSVHETDVPSRRSTTAAWRSSIGARVQGRLGRYVFFDLQADASRARPPRVQVPDEGRSTAPRLGKVTLRGDTYEYTSVRGTVGLRTRFFEVRAGRDQNRWGPGAGSVMLSNFGPAYNQLQLRTTVWRVQYTNLYTRYAAPAGPSAPDETPDLTRRPRSYGASHRLAIDLTDNIEIGLFETIVFAPERDSTVNRRGYDVAFLNPIIFLRAVERELGSPDRALVGIDGAWTATPGLRLYGQFVLDEFVANEIGQQWWGNKWAWTLGAHVVLPAQPDLSLRAEFARLRPHIYAHTYVPNSYAHWDDGLGYPTGPNSIDMALRAEYQPAGAWQAGLNVAYTQRGRNTETQNFGSDATRTNQTRERDRGVAMLQGVRQNILMLEGHVGVEVLPQLIVEAAVRAEQITDAERPRDRYVHPYLAVRWGLPFQSTRY